jgi:hypothetical protein
MSMRSLLHLSFILLCSRLSQVFVNPMSNHKCWIAVASKEHVLRGKAGGFAQVCHGKEGPLKQMREGDFLVYYSPTTEFGKKGKDVDCKSFTSIGRVANGGPYQFQMSPDFIPYRININYSPEASETSILPLIDQLSFIKDKKKWGFPFRAGCFRIPNADFDLISAQMLPSSAGAASGSTETNTSKKISSTSSKDVPAEATEAGEKRKLTPAESSAAETKTRTKR